MQHLAATERAEQRAERLAYRVRLHYPMASNSQTGRRHGGAEPISGGGLRVQPEITPSRRRVNRKINQRCSEGISPPARPPPPRRALGVRDCARRRLVFTAPDGEERVIVVSAAPLRVRRQVTGAVVVWHDVTEREALLASVARARDELEARVDERTAELKQTVALLQESEERFRTLFEAVPLGISRTTYSGQMLMRIPPSASCWGVRCRNPSGSAADFYAKPGDRKRLLASVRRRASWTIRTFLAAKNGRVFPALLRSTRVSFRGQRALLNTTRDVTQRSRRRSTSTHAKSWSSSPRSLAAANTSCCRRFVRDWWACGDAGSHLGLPGVLPYAAALGFPRASSKLRATLP